MTNINPQIEASWKEVLMPQFESDYFLKLKSFLAEEKKKDLIYPNGKNIFAVFDFVPFHKVKVVILGQDPYHGEGQAHGLSFSVPQGIKIPPSLQNIFKELKSDLNIEAPTSGNLEKWAQQGVFLLNATLTVRANEAGSHQKKGWEQFTDSVIKCLSEKRENLVFILWGNYAQAKEKLIDTKKHYIIKSAHPSPLSAYNGFWESKPFSKTNTFLESKGLKTINWNLK